MLNALLEESTEGLFLHLVSTESPQVDALGHFFSTSHVKQHSIWDSETRPWQEF